MGCTSSRAANFENIVLHSHELKRALIEFELLRMTTEDVRLLFYVFDKMITPGNSTIKLTKLLRYAGISSTLFSLRVLTVFSSNPSGDLDFRAFVLSVWNYCTLSNKNMDLFVFDLYDKHGSKPLPPSEISTILTEMHGVEQMTKNVRVRNTEVELRGLEERKKTFTNDQFHDFMLSREALLAPAFQIQRTLQRKLGGATFWKQQTFRREMMFTHDYVSIAHLLNSRHIGLHSLLAEARSVHSGATEDAPASGSSSSKKKSKQKKSGSNKVHAENSEHTASTTYTRH